MMMMVMVMITFI